MMDIAAGMTIFKAERDVAILYKSPKFMNLGKEESPPENVPSAAEDANVAKGRFKADPTPVATTNPTKDDGIALVNRGSNWTMEKQRVAMEMAGFNAPAALAD
mmetsp:Transcript_10685/g.13943  ORF Transcript_10685/g.13943 Transcript_10685/m.13943 type:complete len:103 (-) Transcript_10685:346-654(-)